LPLYRLTPLGPPDWHRAPANVKAASRAAYEYCKVKFTFVFEMAIGKKLFIYRYRLLLKANNVSLSRLALNFSINHQATDITVVSNSSVEILEENVASLNELNDHEKEVLEHIRNRCV